MPFGDAPAGSFGQFAAPAGLLVTGSLSNRGNPTAFGEDNTFRVLDQQQIRLVDNSGNVLFSGYGPDAANQAVALGQSISEAEGNKAGWTIETGERTINPDGSVGPTRWVAAANEKVNVSPIGAIADIALPVAGSLLAGPLGLGALGLGAAGTAAAGAALGSGLSSAAQGRSLEDALLRAAIAGGTSYLGGQLFGPASPTGDVVAQTPSLAGDALANLPSLIDDIAATAAQNLASAGLGAAVPAAASGVGEIVVNALQNTAPSLVAPVISGALNVVPSLISQPSVTPDEIVVTAQTQQPVAPPITPILPSSPTATPPAFPEDIIVTAQSQSPVTTPITPILPSSPTATPPSFPDEIVVTAPSQPQNPFGGFSGLLTLTGVPTTPTPTPTTPTTVTPEPVPTEDIVVTAPSNTNVITPPLIPPVFLPPTTTPPATTPTDTTPPAKKDDFLGTGLSLTQLAAILGVGTDLLGNLLGGSGTTPTTPYVSPFGTGTGILPGVAGRTQVAPNIADYERYGFGPEAAFFSGVQSGPATYKPLI